eukprot:TRINITY_DN16378_c0_g1_i1.p1 TRINITY_DN16378_c0_g1~~TRINITY_DN16378_c0_g1_i1.p1  ORF type:complete len:202 (-),score=4.32 TRINITY_DN16378_c0_g1_i1:80-685(-)
MIVIYLCLLAYVVDSRQHILPWWEIITSTSCPFFDESPGCSERGPRVLMYDRQPPTLTAGTFAGYITTPLTFEVQITNARGPGKDGSVASISTSIAGPGWSVNSVPVLSGAAATPCIPSHPVQVGAHCRLAVTFDPCAPGAAHARFALGELTLAMGSPQASDPAVIPSHATVILAAMPGCAPGAQPAVSSSGGGRSVSSGP